MTHTNLDRHYPGPHPDDSSFQAFCDEYECRYDVMPVWWWEPDRRQAVFLQWQRRKEDEAKARLGELRGTNAAVKGGARFFDALDPKEQDDG